MNNEEAARKLKGYKGIIMYPTDEAEALKDMAIQALEKANIYDDGEHYVTISKALYDRLNVDTCTDAVSREAVLKEFEKGTENLYGRIDKLSSVNPQSSEHFIDGVHAMGYREGYKDAQKQKSGKWIMSDDGLYRPICDKCGAHPWKGYIPTVEEATEVFKFCPNCGAKMTKESRNADSN